MQRGLAGPGGHHLPGPDPLHAVHDHILAFGQAGEDRGDGGVDWPS